MLASLVLIQVVCLYTDGQLQSMDVLLKAGANADAQSDVGETALMLAVQGENANACAKLLKLVCPLPMRISLSFDGHSMQKCMII